MAEASDGKAIFEDTQEDTFIRFCQFAYTGNYTTPEFTHKPAVEAPDISPSVALSHDASRTDRGESGPIEEPSPEPEIDLVLEPEPDETDIWGLKPKNSKKSKKPSKSRLLRQSLDDKLYDVGTIRTALQRDVKFVRTLVPRRITLQFSLVMHSYTSLQKNGALKT
jgi:hypothetical protein